MSDMCGTKLCVWRDMLGEKKYVWRDMLHNILLGGVWTAIFDDTCWGWAFL